MTEALQYSSFEPPVVPTRRYTLNDLTLNKESGEGAEPKLVQSLVDEITAGWGEITGAKPANPHLLLLTGLQGAGKTTIIEALRQVVPLVVVRADVIRSKLRQRGINHITATPELNATRNALLLQGLASGYHTVVDQNANPTRLQLVQSIVAAEQPNYTILNAYLHASPETLRQRVESRPQAADSYTGTVAELENCIRMYGDLQFNPYDEFVDTEKMTPAQIVTKLLARMG